MTICTLILLAAQGSYNIHVYFTVILQKLLDMFAENLKQATSFTLHRAFPSNGNHTESPEPAHEQAPPPADKEAETLHTTRDDILRLQQISKDVSTKNNRKRGKETVGELFIHHPGNIKTFP